MCNMINDNLQVDRHFTEDTQSIENICLNINDTCDIWRKIECMYILCTKEEQQPLANSCILHIFQIIVIVSVYPGMVASVVTTPFFSIRINSRSPKIRVRSIPSTKAIGLLIRASVPAPSPHPWGMR